MAMVYPSHTNSSLLALKCSEQSRRKIGYQASKITISAAGKTYVNKAVKGSLIRLCLPGPNKEPRIWSEPKSTSFWIKSKLALGNALASRPSNCLDHIDVHRHDYNVRAIFLHHILYLLSHVIGDQELVGDQCCWFWLVFPPFGVDSQELAPNDNVRDDGLGAATGVTCRDPTVESPPVA
eukprot:3240458-Ditylum_brightwellii.AAC.1